MWSEQLFEVSYEYVAIVIGVSQLGLAGLVAALDYSTRSRGSMGRGTAAASGPGGAASARRLLAGAPSASEAVAAVRSASGADSTHALIALGLERVRPVDRDACIQLLRNEAWVQQTLKGARSLLWWKRLSAARTLSLIADERDRATILGLLADSHPAVQSAATACLRRYADDALLVRVIDGLSSASSAVRAYQLGMLAEHAELVAPMLLERIRADAPPHKLYAYINAAGVLEDTECMARVAELSTHPHAEVRVAVARVLRSTPGDTVHVKLLAMLRDPDWRVRAQAARGLAVVQDQRTVQELSRALTDPNWWVRFRAGLALADMGEVGRDALTSALSHSDRYARDMATLVGGLSASSVAELSAG